MEDINRRLQEKNKSARRRGEINLCNTTRTRMGQEGHSNVFKNTNRNNGLEWKC